MLGGMALASIPIIIHILNRRRFQIVEWAPMKYLKLTIKTNRRRLRIEQLILLAMRTLLIILLFLAVARPVLSAGGGLLASRSRVSRFVVIDDSLSMGYEQNHRSAFNSAKDAARQVLRAIGAQDDVTVITTSAPASPLVREASLPDPAKVLSQIDDLQPSDGANHWAATLKSLESLLAGATFSQKEVVLITDLRKSGWTGEVHDWAAKWADQSAHLGIIDVGVRETSNVAVTRLESDDPAALVGSPLKFHATVRNDTTALIAGAQATLAIGDAQHPMQLPDLPAGQSTDVPLTITPQQPGPLAVKFSTQTDPLAADNTRWLALNVRPRLDLTLLNGTPGSGPFESATDYLQVAFSIGAEPWHTTKVEEAYWQSARTPPSDVIVLANIASIPPNRAAELEKSVRDGVGLMIFAGEQVDPQFYNERLGALLPAKLDRAVDAAANGLAIEPIADSPLAPMAKVAPAALSRIRPKRFMAVIPPAADAHDVRILARWNDPESHPAVIEKRIGRGRVLLWTISADRQWSDWPIDPTYVLAVRSAALAIARPDPSSDNIAAGQPIDVSTDGAVLDARVAPPSPDTAKSIASLHLDAVAHAGPYLFSWKDAQGNPQQHLVCANPDAVESDLTPISDADLSELFRPIKPQITHYTANGPSVTEPGKEMWRTIATLLLILAAAESAMAVWVGRER